MLENIKKLENTYGVEIGIRNGYFCAYLSDDDFVVADKLEDLEIKLAYGMF